MTHSQSNIQAQTALLRHASGIDTLVKNSLCCAAAGITAQARSTAEALISHEKLRGAATTGATLIAQERQLAQPVVGYMDASQQVITCTPDQTAVGAPNPLRPYQLKINSSLSPLTQAGEVSEAKTAIDLFSGFGGWSTGALAAGFNVLWAANHWPDAVKWHAANHPETQHVCQDLHQARWDQVPAHDLLLASPCCQGHSKARGKKFGNPKHDSSRSTAWAVVSALEFHRPEFSVVENVPEFIQWPLYPAWLSAVQALGYQVAPHVVDCADLGVPQHRVRLFLVLTRSKAPLILELRRRQHVPAASFLDFNTGRWSLIDKPGRAQATLERVRNGRASFGDRFIMPYYSKGSGLTGRDINRPIGTITTLDRWALVDGDHMRMLSANEAMAAQSFPTDTLRPDSHRLTMHMAGNAVPPLAGQLVIEALMAAA